MLSVDMTRVTVPRQTIDIAELNWIEIEKNKTKRIGQARIQGVGAGARAHPWDGVSQCKTHYSIAFEHQSTSPLENSHVTNFWWDRRSYIHRDHCIVSIRSVCDLTCQWQTCRPQPTLKFQLTHEPGPCIDRRHCALKLLHETMRDNETRDIALSPLSRALVASSRDDVRRAWSYFFPSLH